MSNRHTTYRAMHDIGLAAWFGGSLFGVAGLNAAAGEAPDRRSARRLASVGWAKWTPTNAVAIATHGIGAIGLLSANQRRVAHQPGVARNTAVKAGLTLAALGVSAYARVLGKKLEDAEIHQSSEVPSSATSTVASTGAGGPSSVVGEADKRLGQTVSAVAEQLPFDVEQAERHLHWVQFAIPALTGAALVLGAQHGEQQRPSEQLREVARRAVGV